MESSTKDAATFCLCIWGWCVGHMQDAQVVIVYLTVIVMSYQVCRIFWLMGRRVCRYLFPGGRNE